MAAPTGQRPTIAAEAFLRALADHGVDYFFCNPGTDFPPIVEAFGRAKKTNAKVPKPILVPHENLAVAMAHGAYLMNGRPQAVMVHTTAGTANSLNNLLNARARPRAADPCRRSHADHRERLVRLTLAPDPMGPGNVRPGRHGARAGEMGLRIARARADRRRGGARRGSGDGASARARSTSCCRASRLPAPLSEPTAPVKPRPLAADPYPDPRSLATLAEWIAAAERPLILAATLPAAAVERLAAFAERCAIPVVTHNPRTVCLPSSHAMHFGFEPGALLGRRRLGDRSGIGRAVDSAFAASAGRLPRRPYRRGSFLCALSDALLPERHRRAGGRQPCAGGAGRGGRAAPANGGGAHRRPPRAADRAHAHQARATRKGFGGGRAHLAGISFARHRRSGGRGRRHLQRISAAARPLRAREAGHLLRARSRRRARLGLRRGARRQARRRPTTSSSPRSATAPTCSAIRWSATGLPPRTNCRS